MPHQTAFLATVAAALGAAFLLGLIAARCRFAPIVGYLVAGILVAPLARDDVTQAAISQLSEVGVILLMFGVGLHFSFRDLLAVRRVVVPGALALTGVTATLGTFIGHAWGLGWGGGVVLGLSLGVASTVVLLKGLEGRDRLDSPEGRIAIGWLVVEDITMVFALVLLVALAPLLGGGATAPDNVWLPLGLALGKVVAFVALMVFVGARLVPWLLEHVARVGSRELFTLAVLTTALGVGTLASNVFGISFALGAFFAGAVINESELSHRAAADALPMQDAFSVLFFVSVGMLFDPAVLTSRWADVLVLAAIIVVWKSVAAFGLLRMLGVPTRSALVVGGALGQIGEFSFIVAGMGVALGLANHDLEAVIVAAAIVAITVNSPVMSAIVGLVERMTRRAADEAPADEDTEDFSDFNGHVVLVGHGRVGGTVADALVRAGAQHVVVEEQERVVRGLRARGEPAILGDASRHDVLARAGIETAGLIVITAPEPFRARRIVEVARLANPGITVAVRTHSAAEQAYFEQHLSGPHAAGRAVYAEREAALNLAHYALLAIGRSDDEADVLVSVLRGEATTPTETFKALMTREFRALSAVTTAERRRRVEPMKPGGN